MTYQEFLNTKTDIAQESGFEVPPEDVNPALYDPFAGFSSVGYQSIKMGR